MSFARTSELDLIHSQLRFLGARANAAVTAYEQTREGTQHIEALEAVRELLATYRTCEPSIHVRSTRPTTPFCIATYLEAAARVPGVAPVYQFLDVERAAQKLIAAEPVSAVELKALRHFSKSLEQIL